MNLYGSLTSTDIALLTSLFTAIFLAMALGTMAALHRMTWHTFLTIAVGTWAWVTCFHLMTGRFLIALLPATATAFWIFLLHVHNQRTTKGSTGR